MVRLYFLLLCSIAAFLLPATVHAQSIELRMQGIPLAEALTVFGTKSGIDFIYAVDLVDSHTISCSYKGANVEDALSCLLADTNIQAKRLHAKQYILAPLPAGSPPATGQPSLDPLLISGFITDSATGLPLPGAHVFFPEIRRGAITNKKGYFQLEAAEENTYEANISYLGYKALKTSISTKDHLLTIALNPITLEGHSVLVEADEQTFPSDASIPGLVSLDLQDLQNLPGFGGENDLFQVLQWTPGVHKAGAFNNGLLVRGGLEDQNLYLIDGAPVYHPWHAFNLISSFQTDAFQDIKLYRGSFPAQHGGRLASVLDARVKDGNRSSPTAVAGFSLLSGRFLIESPLTRKSSFMISGRRSYLDKVIGSEHPVQDRDGTRDTLRTGYHFSDITAKLSSKLNDRHRISTTFYSGGDILDLRLPFDLSLDFSSWLRPAELFFEVDHNWGNTIYTFQHQYIISDRVLLTNTAYRSSYNANEGEIIRPTSSSLVQSQYHVRVKDLGIKTDLDYFWTASHHIQGGLHIVDHRFNSSLNAAIQRSPGSIQLENQHSNLNALEGAVYLQDSWRPHDDWQIQPGVRLSYFSGGSYFFVNPRLSIQHIVNPRYLVLSASAGTQVQYMQQLRDRFSFMYDLISSRWIPTSDHIRPASSFQVSLEGESQPLPWLKLSSEAYYRSSKDILLPRDEFQTKDQIEGPGIEVSNLLAQYTSGLSRAYGLELTAIIEHEPWKLLVNYAGGRTLSRAPLLDETAFRPTRFDMPRFLRTALTRQYSDWHLTVSFFARSGYPITTPVAKYSIDGPVGDEPTQYLYRPEINNGRLPAYMRLDLSLGYRFDMLGAKWHTQFHLYNFTNRRNVIDRFYDPTKTVVTAEDRKGFPILPLFEIEMSL